MGDRALIQFTDGAEVSPVIYLHWHGSIVRSLINETRELMQSRGSDLTYAAARFVGIAHSHIPGNLSLGMWNLDRRLTADDSHGDFGCAIVDVRDWSVECFGGYGEGRTLDLA